MVGGFIILNKSHKTTPFRFLTTKYHLDWELSYNISNKVDVLVITIYVTENKFAMMYITQETADIYNDVLRFVPVGCKLEIRYKDPSLKQFQNINL